MTIFFLLFEHPSYLFVDIDECLENNGECEHTCTDNVDGVTCGCDVGYEINMDGTTCDGTNTVDTMYIILSLPGAYMHVSVFFVVVDSH